MIRTRGDEAESETRVHGRSIGRAGRGGALPGGMAVMGAVCSLAVRAPSLQAATPIAQPVKIAVISDTGDGAEFQSVLTLIQRNHAQLVIHSGGLSQSSSIETWVRKVNTTLGAAFPYFLAKGNLDVPEWGDLRTDACRGAVETYAEFQRCHLDAAGITPALHDDADRYAVTYQGVKIVLLSEAANPVTNAAFIREQLGGDDHLWKLCAWHETQHELQMGTRSNEMGWEPYDACRQAGALIMTGHEYSYERTYPMTDVQHLTKDPSCSSNPAVVCVSPGRTFVTVSGLGGTGIRNQDRCLPTTFPYGQGLDATDGNSRCNGLWAKLYTSDQGATFGALFITFNVGGDPTMAQAEFMTIRGDVADRFIITDVHNAGSV